MSEVGLVLGGGGVTGASYHFGALIALEMATGWDPQTADVIVGTSSGAFVSAVVRGGALGLDAMIGGSDHVDEAAEWLRGYVYRRSRPQAMLRWLRSGVLPRLSRPNLGLVLGSPGLYETGGIQDWVAKAVGPLAESWPAAPTVIVAYDLEGKRRVPFGTEAAPSVPLKLAVAASSAMPFVYQPVSHDGCWYVDGGVATGTSADLVLANPEPLDLVLILAPMAARNGRRRARFYEDLVDRAGRATLTAEADKIKKTWPECDVLVLRPDERVLEVARPNPLSVDAAIPVFLATLRSMRDELAHPATWEVLERHLKSRVGVSQQPGA